LELNIIDISSTTPKTFQELKDELDVRSSSLSNALRSIIQRGRYGGIACRLEVVNGKILHKYQYDPEAKSKPLFQRDIMLVRPREKKSDRSKWLVARRRKDGTWYPKHLPKRDDER
jgi:hypothetical protein